jgi:hypothetical protein
MASAFLGRYFAEEVEGSTFLYEIDGVPNNPYCSWAKQSVSAVRHHVHACSAPFHACSTSYAFFSCAQAVLAKPDKTCTSFGLVFNQTWEFDPAPPQKIFIQYGDPVSG